ncbi:hypothetical protein DVS77_15230 [Mycolicibacterium moriokaense]|nr:hypothetical protein DVS77_15230 [Mycolicibacterium moriokaense]
MRQALDEDGIFVVRNALSQAEIGELRDILVRHLTMGGLRFSLGKTQPNAAEMVPDLSFIFAHPRILAVVKQVLGETNVIFTGHCDIHMNMLSGWHKDSGENVPGGYFTGPYMTSADCRVFKVAIYLQDSGRRDGFTARLGSHRETVLRAGNKVRVQSRTGDIVVFDVRITHTGQLPDPVEKGLKGVSLALNRGERDREDPVWVSRIKALYSKLIGRRDRLSLFFTFGAANSFTYDFARSNMSRQAREGATIGSAGLPSQLKDALEREGVQLSDAVRTRDEAC